MKLPFAIAFLCLLSLLSSCATLHRWNHSEPKADTDATVVLFATGDLRGALLPVEPEHGGSALLESYFKTLREDFGSRLLWLDAGDLRGESLDYGFDRGASFEKFIQDSGMAASLAGYQPPVEPPGKILLASATSATQSSAASSPAELDAEHPSMALLRAGELHIGVVSARTARDLAAQAAKARAEGAQLVVWLSDLPIRCNPNGIIQHVVVHRPGEPNGFCEGAIHDIVWRLPEGTINAVIASGGGRPLERFVYPRYSSNPVAGVPIVEDAPFGRDFHLIYLSFNLKSGQPVLAQTRIEGPVPVEPAKFNHREISADRSTVALIRPVQDWLNAQEKTILASASLPLAGAGLGDLVADALREQTQSDFALLQPGMTKHAFGRAALPAGPITQIDLERALPSDGPAVVIKLSGEELKTLVRISENGSRGFAAVSGMKLRLIRPDRDVPATDLNGDHALSMWERNRLLEITDLDDESIRAHQTYRLALPSYLVGGGDDWQWASRKLGLLQRIDQTYPSIRELVAQHLKQLGKITEMPARIRFENPPGRRHRRGHRRHRHSGRSHSRKRNSTNRGKL